MGTQIIINQINHLIMENLLLTVLLSNTSIIVLVCVLWYVIGLVISLAAIYITEYGVITLMGLILSLFTAIFGPVLIFILLLVKYELFDNIVIYKNK